MLTTSTARTADEIYLDIFQKFRDDNPGRRVRMEDVARHIHDQGLLPTPSVDVVQLHTRKLKQAARRKRINDLKGRKIRPWLAAKIERFTANGQKVFDVVWDHIHEMSIDHALSAFGQRDDVIKKQKRSATRDLQSFLDFNPNAEGHERQFIFDFMDEEPIEAMMETIEESPTTPTKPWLPPKG